jgi:hypothetical protein
LFLDCANLAAQYGVELIGSTVGMIAFRHINDEDSNAVIRDSKTDLFVEILMVEKRQLSETTQNSKHDA